MICPLYLALSRRVLVVSLLMDGCSAFAVQFEGRGFTVYRKCYSWRCHCIYHALMAVCEGKKREHSPFVTINVDAATGWLFEDGYAKEAARYFKTARNSLRNKLKKPPSSGV